MHSLRPAARLPDPASAETADRVDKSVDGKMTDSKPVEEVESKSKPKTQSPEKRVPVEPPLSIWNPKSSRFQFTMLLLFVVMANTMMRNTMSMAIICIVNNTATEDSSLKTNATRCPIIAEEDDTKYEGWLLWNSNDKGLALSAIYWSGLLTAIPAGYYADRYSPKVIIAGSLLVSIIGCFLTPVAVTHGDLQAVIALRFLMGFAGQATVMTTASSMSAKWIPPGDRTTCVALYTTGAQLGMMIAGPLNAFLCQQPNFLGGWPSIFYVTGFIVVPILVTWLICAADKPRKYRWIRKTELVYITDSLAEQHLRKRKTRCRHIPWKRILISGPLLVSLLGNLSLSTTITMFQQYTPTYFKQSLKMHLAKNGLFSALPFLAQLVGKVVCAPLADRIRTKKVLSPTWGCKTFNSIGTFGSAIFLIATAYMTCNEAGAAVSFMAIGSFFYSFQMAGFVTSLVAIAPAFTGIVNALSRLIGQIAAVITPAIIGLMTDGSSDATTQWRNVYWTVASISIGAGLLFLAFGSAEIQDWAKRKQDDDDDDGGSGSEDTASIL